MEVMVTTKLAALITALVTLVTGFSANLPEKPENPTDEPSQTEEMDIKDITPIELISRITIGWNLGNSLDCTSKSETAWGNPVTTEEMILAVKDAGFNAVRIPVTWYTSCDADWNIDEAWMNRVEEVVNYVYKNDMYAIINLHHENWHFPSEENKKSAKKIIKKLWTQIGNRFKNYDEHLIFEGLNEPRKFGTKWEWNGGDSEGQSVVNEYNAAFVSAVRATGGNNKYRCLMIPTYAASASGLSGFELPDDDRLIVDIHAYSPYNFAMNTGNGSTTKFSKDDKNSTSELDWLSDTLNERFISKGVGVVIGECGATNKDNLADRIRWAKYFPEVFGRYGIPIFLWDNNGYGVGSEKFGLLHRDTLKWEYPTFIETIVSTAKKTKRG